MTNPAHGETPTKTSFLGLAPFLRMSIAGEDLMPAAQELLARAQERPEDAELWMNLSTAMQCLGQREVGLSIQNQALGIQQLYHLPAAVQPAVLRLLMLLVPGDIAANTPLDCLLERSDIDLDLLYLSADGPLPESLPDHDVLMVAMGDSQENRPLLGVLDEVLAAWPRPVVNRPAHIPATARDTASQLLRDAPGVLMPPTLQLDRSRLAAIAGGAELSAEDYEGLDFPLILRPVGSQAGRDLARIADRQELDGYLGKVAGDDFFLSQFIDYSGADGQFRKYRVALIDGRPFGCHMGVSSDWMVHYVNAGMYADAAKRDEEADFMAHFDRFADRHRDALNAVHQRMGLDYLCIDCAETREGRLLIFEADHVMVVHAMDPEDLFPYKQVHMLKAKNAFRDYVLGLATAGAAGRERTQPATPTDAMPAGSGE